MRNNVFETDSRIVGNGDHQPFFPCGDGFRIFFQIRNLHKTVAAEEAARARAERHELHAGFRAVVIPIAFERRASPVRHRKAFPAEARQAFPRRHKKRVAFVVAQIFSRTCEACSREQF